jgi:hypothetical protein
MTADASGCTVVTGPIEAAALGVLMMQAVATGHLANVAEGPRCRRRFDRTGGLRTPPVARLGRCLRPLLAPDRLTAHRLARREPPCTFRFR